MSECQVLFVTALYCILLTFIRFNIKGYWQNKPKKHPVTGKDNMHYCCGDLPLAFHGYKDSKWFFKLENEFYSEVSDEEGDSWKRYEWLGDPAVTSKYFDRVRGAMNKNLKQLLS